MLVIPGRGRESGSHGSLVKPGMTGEQPRQ